uniref:Uncharacterized protein n=1 Tax=Ciona intestinalis TaxID=7719 RepID=H2XM16_CIOIN
NHPQSYIRGHEVYKTEHLCYNDCRFPAMRGQKLTLNQNKYSDHP